MDELRMILDDKLEKYAMLYEASKELKQTDNQEFYIGCMDKLNRMIDIANE